MLLEVATCCCCAEFAAAVRGAVVFSAIVGGLALPAAGDVSAKMVVIDLVLYSPQLLYKLKQNIAQRATLTFLE
jgi:hypothetical protein